MSAVRITISMQEHVRDILQEDAKKIGMPVSTYISYLITQKNIEHSAMRIISNMTDEQLKKELVKIGEAK